MNMKTSIAILLACAISTTVVAQTNRQIEQVIRDEGAISFSDGSSIFTFKDSGEFTLQPIGMSGRTISGTWTNDGSSILVITGQWGWINGISRDNDHREMRLIASLKNDSPISQSSLGPVWRWKLYDVYFTIEDIHPAEGESLKKKEKAEPAG